jgi:hypothetical protein
VAGVGEVRGGHHHHVHVDRLDGPVVLPPPPPPPPPPSSEQLEREGAEGEVREGAGVGRRGRRLSQKAWEKALPGVGTHSGEGVGTLSGSAFPEGVGKRERGPRRRGKWGELGGGVCVCLCAQVKLEARLVTSRYM